MTDAIEEVKPIGFKWISSPGDTIVRIISEQQSSISSFSSKLGVDTEDLIGLIHGNTVITEELARKLSEILNGSIDFWLRREQIYRNSLEAELHSILASKDQDTFYIKLAHKLGVSLSDLRSSFEIRDLRSIRERYISKVNILFSRDQRFEPNPFDFVLWLRNCEKVGERKIINMNAGGFDPARLREILPNILDLTKVNKVKVVIPKLEILLASCGVILVTSPSESGSGISGATKRLLNRYRLVIVTDRYKINAAFWQTLLHELAHCCLHSLHETLAHYTDSELGLQSNTNGDRVEEDEAISFVEDLLFDSVSDVISNTSFKSYKAFMKLSVDLGISSSLLLAKLHRIGKVPYNWRKAFRSVNFSRVS